MNSRGPAVDAFIKAAEDLAKTAHWLLREDGCPRTGSGKKSLHGSRTAYSRARLVYFAAHNALRTTERHRNQPEQE